jgi:alkylated DNA repair dioxygenase AlkB
MGWHSDDEPELGQKPLIASVSLGAERRFLVRPKGGGVSERVILGHGSLLLMTGDSQANWQHSIPKTKRNVGLRINLTFRQIQSPAPKSAT